MLRPTFHVVVGSYSQLSLRMYVERPTKRRVPPVNSAQAQLQSLTESDVHTNDLEHRFDVSPLCAIYDLQLAAQAAPVLPLCCS